MNTSARAVGVKGSPPIRGGLTTVLLVFMISSPNSIPTDCWLVFVDANHVPLLNMVGRARLATPKLRFRTRDQRIKRSRSSSKPYINQ